jgi:glycosyltransferase involved in cell wall biosynthesis
MNTLNHDVKKQVVFGCYGAARWEKGSDIFQEAIRLLLRKADNLKLEKLKSFVPERPLINDLRFAIQWLEDFTDDNGNLVKLDPWLRNHPQVEVICRFFQGDEYEQQLERTDVMVLPYRKPYRLRVSRVVIEAMLNSMPVIATRETTLFEQGEEYGVAVACEEGSAESLAQAILEVAEGFEKMRVSAMERATTAAQRFSVNYFRELLEKNEQKY